MYYVNDDAFLQVKLGESGLTYDQVTAELLAPNGIQFEAIEFEELDFQSATGLWYRVRIPAQLLTINGCYVLTISHAGGDTEHVFDVAYPHLGEGLPPQTALLIGNIRNIAGEAPVWQQVEVKVRGQNFPTVAGNSILLGKPGIWLTDHTGDFKIPIIRGSRIEVEIPACGVRFKYDVPHDQDIIDVAEIMTNM